MLKLNKKIQSLIASYIFQFSGVGTQGVVVVHRVEISRDLRSGKVYINTIDFEDLVEGSGSGNLSEGSASSKKVLKDSLGNSSHQRLNRLNNQNVNFLQSKSHAIQKYIHSRLRTKFCPKLTFYKDSLYEKQDDLDKAFSES